MSAMTAALAAGAVLGGILLVIVGLTGLGSSPQAPTGPSRHANRLQSLIGRFDRRTRQLFLIGIGIGVVLAIVTGWLIAIILAPVTLAGVPLLLGAPKTAVQIDRLEAMEEWSRSLAGVLVAGRGIEQALIASVRSAPDAIRPEVATLASRLRARWSTEDALRVFADDLNDATGDLIVANLILGAKQRKGGLAAVLEALAESVAEDVRKRRQVEADRAKPRTTARLVTGIALGALGLMLFVSGDYISEFGTPIGQAIFMAEAVAFTALLIVMKVMTIGKPLPRFVGATVTEATDKERGPR